MAVTGKPTLNPPFQLSIHNVASVSYNSVLFPSRVEVLEEEAMEYNPDVWKNKHDDYKQGNFGTLRVLPVSVPRLHRSAMNNISSALERDFDARDANRTDFLAYFKRPHFCLTLSSEVNMEPSVMVPVDSKLDQPVFVTVLKYSEKRHGYQQIDIETTNHRLQFTTSLSPARSELNFEKWRDVLSTHHMNFVLSEKTLEINPDLHIIQMFGQAGHEDFEDEIIESFTPVKPVPVEQLSPSKLACQSSSISKLKSD